MFAECLSCCACICVLFKLYICATLPDLHQFNCTFIGSRDSLLLDVLILVRKLEKAAELLLRQRWLHLLRLPTVRAASSSAERKPLNRSRGFLLSAKPRKPGDTWIAFSLGLSKSLWRVRSHYLESCLCLYLSGLVFFTIHCSHSSHGLWHCCTCFCCGHGL